VNITIKQISSEDAIWLKSLIECEWGGNPLVIRGKSYYPEKLPGLIAFKENNRIGFLSYEIRENVCEIIAFEVFEKFCGIGSKMLNRLINTIKENGCNQIYLMTTNDNLDALRFYQRRGFHITNIHINSIKQSRVIKPSIPNNGDFGIPLRDEIDLTLKLIGPTG
jgi:N-acetylglutamate synthase-like GNAT family acetyltransferase